MARQELVTFTNMCMVYDEDKVLVQDKVDDDYCGITFPGGHVEKGEAYTDAVIREVYEETGLSIERPQLCGIKDWMNDDGTRYVVLLYKTNIFSGHIKSSDEGEVYWVSLSELSNMRLAEGMDKTLKVFMEDEMSEYFFYKKDDKWIEELK